MKRKLLATCTLLLSAALLGMSGIALSDDDGDEGGRGGMTSRWFGAGNVQPGVAPVKNPQYLEECGACHFPYQPGLLPARSWTKLMATLDNHFGENAELPADTAKAIESYLLAYAADQSNHKRSRRIAQSIPASEAPLRISKTPYFLKEHRELKRKVVQDNPKVRSFSNCDACHTTAAKGYYGENGIRIPGFGRWEDD